MLQKINFKRPGKGQLHEEVKTSGNLEQHFCQIASWIPDEKLAQLWEISPNTAFFSSLPSNKIDDKSASDYDSVYNNWGKLRLSFSRTIDKFIWLQCHKYGRSVTAGIFCQKNLILWKLFQPGFVWQNHGNYNITESVKCVETHQIGRITPWNFCDVIHCKSGKSKVSLKKLMNYVAVPLNSPSLVYGREVETAAKKSYTNSVKKHENFMVSAPILTVSCIKYFQILYIFTQIFKYFALF